MIYWAENPADFSHCVMNCKTLWQLWSGRGGWLLCECQLLCVSHPGPTQSICIPV